MTPSTCETSTACGTPIVVSPAASALRAPVIESSIATLRAGGALIDGEAGQGVVPYLPLDQLRRSGSGAAAAQPAPNLTGRPTATVPGAATGVPGTTNSAPGATASNITGGGN